MLLTAITFPDVCSKTNGDLYIPACHLLSGIIWSLRPDSNLIASVAHNLHQQRVQQLFDSADVSATLAWSALPPAQSTDNDDAPTHPRHSDRCFSLHLHAMHRIWSVQCALLNETASGSHETGFGFWLDQQLRCFIIESFCKKWVLKYWRGYLSGARCKLFAYGPADATATPSSLAPVKSRMVYLSGAGLLRLSWKKGR